MFLGSLICSVSSYQRFLTSWDMEGFSMADQHKQKPHDEVEQQAQAALSAARLSGQKRQFALWIAALIVGGILGWANVPALNDLFSFIATVFTRLFQFVAVPTIALAVITTLAALGAKKDTGKIFAHAVTYTLLTTFCAAAMMVCRPSVSLLTLPTSFSQVLSTRSMSSKRVFVRRIFFQPSSIVASGVTSVLMALSTHT